MGCLEILANLLDRSLGSPNDAIPEPFFFKAQRNF